jgi:hypothetical protein
MISFVEFVTGVASEGTEHAQLFLPHPQYYALGGECTGDRRHYGLTYLFGYRSRDMAHRRTSNGTDIPVQLTEQDTQDTIEVENHGFHPVKGGKCAHSSA